MQDSNLGCQVWAMAIYLFMTSLKSVASMKLRCDLNIAQNSAWHLSHRIRAAGARDLLRNPALPRHLLLRRQLDPPRPDSRPRQARHSSPVRQADQEHLRQTPLPRLENHPQSLVPQRLLTDRSSGCEEGAQKENTNRRVIVFFWFGAAPRRRERRRSHLAAGILNNMKGAKQDLAAKVDDSKGTIRMLPASEVEGSQAVSDAYSPGSALALDMVAAELTAASSAVPASEILGGGRYGRDESTRSWLPAHSGGADSARSAKVWVISFLLLATTGACGGEVGARWGPWCNEPNREWDLFFGSVILGGLGLLATWWWRRLQFRHWDLRSSPFSPSTSRIGWAIALCALVPFFLLSCLVYIAEPCAPAQKWANFWLLFAGILIAVALSLLGLVAAKKRYTGGGRS